MPAYGGGVQTKKKQRSPMGKYVAILLVVLLLLGGVAYLISRTPVVGETQAAECALLVDRTDSTLAGAAPNQFLDIALRTVDGCRRERAALTVFWFDQRADKLVQLNATPYKLWKPRTHNQATSSGALDDEVAAAKSAVKGLFSSVPAAPQRRTDLLTAITGAGAFLRQASSADHLSRSFLVAVTDGLQVSDSLSVESLGKGVTPAQLVSRAVKAGYAPNLAGITVDMVGVNGGVTQSGQQLPGGFVRAVETFWKDLANNGQAASLCWIPKAAVLPAAGPC